MLVKQIQMMITLYYNDDESCLYENKTEICKYKA